MPTFSLFKKEEHISFARKWARSRHKNSGNEPISFFKINGDEYIKLNNKAEPAQQGVHKNLHAKGRISTFKLYKNSDDRKDDAILVKSLKCHQEDPLEINSALQQAKKMLLFGLAHDYIKRTNKDRKVVVDIILPYYEGEDLYNFVSRTQDEAIQKKEIVSLFFQYAIDAMIALENFHKKGWTHLDVKLENFYIDTKDKIVHLIDPEFCLSSGVTKNACLLGGTLEYAAPERLAPNDLLIHPRLDVFSMGVILAAIFGMLKGEKIIAEKKSGKSKKIGFHVDAKDKEFCITSCNKLIGLSEQYASSLCDLIAEMTDTEATNRISLKKAILNLRKIYHLYQYGNDNENQTELSLSRRC